MGRRCFPLQPPALWQSKFSRLACEALVRLGAHAEESDETKPRLSFWQPEYTSSANNQNDENQPKVKLGKLALCRMVRLPTPPKSHHFLLFVPPCLRPFVPSLIACHLVILPYHL